MTNEEIDKFIELMKADPHGEALKIYARLSPDERQQITARTEQIAREGVQEVFKKAEADGTMDRIRELYAEDQAKKKRKKPKP